MLSSIATAGALLAALWQLRMGVLDGRQRDTDRRVARALTLYQDIVAEGATHEGFHRLSVLLRRLGSGEHKITTWHVLQNGDLGSGGCLDPADASREQAFADLYAVMWFFERCEIALERGLVDRHVLFQTIGFHFWWWGEVLRDLTDPKASDSVHRLAARSREWAAQSGVLHDWERRCISDFAGGPCASQLPSSPPSTP